ncbi:MAG: Crp/Fnr family transcriptional regulator [Erysipelotrichaceae bacterium]|nr:Crp/Fnr family transcriptional regulator [Erysipelotrichaceae bacterium]MDD3924308.1 Crp/Fnr family transcriptional regulator [Erysipelotrichaceae bacterium]
MLSKPNCNYCTFNDLCIRKLPLFASLNDDDLKTLFPLIKHHSYHKDEIILLEGQTIDSLMLINDGKLKASKYALSGKEQILHIFDIGDFYGEQFFTDDKINHYTITALTDTKVCTFTKDDFDKILKDHPNISTSLISSLYKRMRKLETTVSHLNIRDINMRVNALLLEYVQKYGVYDGDRIIIDLPINREQMANLLGITRETMSRKLSKLEDQKIIKSIDHKHLQILDISRLTSD